MSSKRSANGSARLPGAVEARVADDPTRAPGEHHLHLGDHGEAKASGFTHAAWTYTAAAIDCLDVLATRRPELPVAAACARSSGRSCWRCPLLIGFPTAIDGRVDKHRRESRGCIRPPSWLRRRASSRRCTAASSGWWPRRAAVKKRIFDWAIGVGLEVSRARQAGHRPSPLLALQQRVADRLVFSTIRSASAAGCGSSSPRLGALDRDVARWFDAVGIVVLEGYGLTETAAASFINRPIPIGSEQSAGRSRNTEVKIADDGEILLRGPGVMTGYHDLPDATAEALDAGRLVPHRRHRRVGRRRVPADHRPQEGHVQDVAGQVRRTVADRGGVQRHLPLREPVDRDRRGQAVLRRTGQPRRRSDHRMGRQERPGRPPSPRSPATKRPTS